MGAPSGTGYSPKGGATSSTVSPAKPSIPSAAFTPGPWHLRDTPWAEGLKHYICAPRGRALATTLSMESSDTAKKAEVAANACLIAAAPELYSALSDAVDLLQMSGYSTLEHTAALRKARGDAA
jgi:hypothetical protein